MNKEEFYITLPSNVSSTDYFPKNTVANFYTKLAQSVVLDGSWEVGLSEVSFTNSWYNITSNQIIEVCNDDKTNLNLVKFPPGRYDNISLLIDTINAILALCKNDDLTDVETPLQFFHEPEARRISLIIGVTKLPIQKPLYVKLGSDLAHMLGFCTSDEHLKRIKKFGRQYIHRISNIDQAIYYRVKERFSLSCTEQSSV